MLERKNMVKLISMRMKLEMQEAGEVEVDDVETYDGEEVTEENVVQRGRGCPSRHTSPRFPLFIICIEHRHYRYLAFRLPSALLPHQITTFSFVQYSTVLQRLEKPQSGLNSSHLILCSSLLIFERLLDPLQYQSIVDAEWNIIYDKLDKCVKTGAKIVLCRLAIGDLATQYFADKDIFCAGRVDEDDLHRVAAATGATVQTSVNNVVDELLQHISILHQAGDILLWTPYPLLYPIVMEHERWLKPILCRLQTKGESSQTLYKKDAKKRKQCLII
ncbi:unnamed protein product [Lactuca saligna]|uniref:Uncharacterized protein n=1 Tax=Lactuca saligna TaxID=75948 RepID=A0AA36A1J9_LACSI|nr:unnamed protein product [Lactuca saligna]